MSLLLGPFSLQPVSTDLLLNYPQNAFPGFVAAIPSTGPQSGALPEVGTSWNQLLDDTFTLGDAWTLASILAKSDTLILSDAQTLAAVLARSDTITLTDAPTKTVILVSADIITLSDVFSGGPPGQALIASFSDGINVFDFIFLPLPPEPSRVKPPKRPNGWRVTDF